MKYQVTAYITGRLVKLFTVEATRAENAIAIATSLATRDWEAGNTRGWDMTMDSEVDEEATEVVDETQG